MLKIIHGDWYCTVIEGDVASYTETALPARQSAKNRGYRFERVDKNEDGQTVEIWRKSC